MNKPTNPIVGDAWTDEETLEIKIWDGREWIVLPEPPTSPLDKLQFGDNDTGFATKDDELTLIPPGVEVSSIKPANSLCIINNFETLVTIDTKTGYIKYGENYNPDETAKIFWEAMGSFKYENNTAQETLLELRNIIGVKENESICSVARELIGKTHDEDCNWHIWDHVFSWSESDCTCVKDDCMKDEPWFVPAGVEMMDFTTPSNTGKGKGSKVEFLPSDIQEKVSVSKDGKMSWRALTKEEIAFNDAMKVIE